MVTNASRTFLRSHTEDDPLASILCFYFDNDKEYFISSTGSELLLSYHGWNVAANAQTSIANIASLDNYPYPLMWNNMNIPTYL